MSYPNQHIENEESGKGYATRGCVSRETRTVPWTYCRNTNAWDLTKGASEPINDDLFPTIPPNSRITALARTPETEGVTRFAHA